MRKFKKAGLTAMATALQKATQGSQFTVPLNFLSSDNQLVILPVYLIRHVIERVSRQIGMVKYPLDRIHRRLYNFSTIEYKNGNFRRVFLSIIALTNLYLRRPGAPEFILRT